MTNLTVSQPNAPVKSRKADLVSLGLWALNAGLPWLIKAVHLALRREGLQHA